MFVTIIELYVIVNVRKSNSLKTVVMSMRYIPLAVADQVMWGPQVVKISGPQIQVRKKKFQVNFHYVTNKKKKEINKRKVIKN